MTDPATTPEPHPQPPERATSGCLFLCVTLFLVALGLFWLISGAIIIPYKAVYVTGTPARVVAILWIVVVLLFSFPRKPRRNLKRGP